MEVTCETNQFIKNDKIEVKNVSISLFKILFSVSRLVSNSLFSPSPHPHVCSTPVDPEWPSVHPFLLPRSTGGGGRSKLAATGDLYAELEAKAGVTIVGVGDC
jgi:hypothetical protein